jgi:hypothetical protein
VLGADDAVAEGADELVDSSVLDEDVVVVVEALVAVGAPTSIVVSVPLIVVSINAAVGIVDTPEVIALSNTTGFALID